MRRILPVLAIVIVTIVFWTFGEGVISLYHDSDPHLSMFAIGRSLLTRRIAPIDPPPAAPATAEGVQRDWIFDHVLTSASELENLIEEFKRSGVALGNSPFVQLRDEGVALNYMGSDGCLRQKPNLTRFVGYLRTTQWFNFDPVSFFYEDPNRLTPNVKAFLQRYALRTALYTTNSFEERTTLPATEQPSKVIISGDSVAAGAIIDDGETIASHLQRDTREHQFINIGINGADPNAAFCAIDREGQRYGTQISALVYIWCENDFDGDPPYHDPQAAMEWLGAFAAKYSIRSVMIVYAPYIYNTVPEVARIAGLTDKRGTYLDQFRILNAAALSHGFLFFNVADVVAVVRAETNSHFGPLAMYVDHAHLSNYGSELVAREIERRLPPTTVSR